MHLDIMNFVGNLSVKVIRSINEKCDEKSKLYFGNHPIRLEGPNVIVRNDETKLNFTAKN